MSRTCATSETSLPPEPPRFLLDENFSHWLGELLPRFDYEVQQVQRVPELGRPTPRVAGLRHGASDEEIAEWCAREGLVVVTCDEDFRSRELRVGAYNRRGVDVVLCTRQPTGLREQLELVVLWYPKWTKAVATAQRHPQLWLQHGPRGPLRLARFS